ncbi:uncharacterized protein TM35_000511040 [Trypanosoma theileri]|uniref:Mucin TcMUCII n=1 Tax=Trypanosoma theileri TaxID=67003 RepID=A0A1X0NHQ1_9TRYP|nr:uncharacterized protein TM35_000511040 [Trypanosoma theileri]ORC84003.1 hypothetical protein TM35_000511040 [Trypanosoma theileri]
MIMMTRYVLCVMLLALCCTCTFVCANTEPQVEVSEPEPEGGGTSNHGARQADGAGGSGKGGQGNGQGVSPGAPAAIPPKGKGDKEKELLDSQDKSELNKDPGPVGPQGHSESQLPGKSTQSPLQPGTSSEPVKGERMHRASSPSANQNDQIQSGGKADSKENEQVIAKTESGNNGGSNSGSEKNTVGSLTAEEPNANSEEHELENAPTSPNENVTQGTNDAGNSSAVQIQGSTDKESEPENGTTPNTNEESSSTTTTTTTTLPPELTNNKKGDADSSNSSISSSVWVRVPLLIVVTLACILVC